MSGFDIRGFEPHLVADLQGRSFDSVLISIPLIPFIRLIDVILEIGLGILQVFEVVRRLRVEVDMNIREFRISTIDRIEWRVLSRRMS